MVSHLAFSPDGSTLASALAMVRSRLWEPCQRIPESHTHGPSRQGLFGRRSRPTERSWPRAVMTSRSGSGTSPQAARKPRSNRGTRIVSRPSPSRPTVRPWPRRATTWTSSCGKWRRKRPVPLWRVTRTTSRDLLFIPGRQTTLVSAADDGMIKLWDPAARDLRTTLMAHTDGVQSTGLFQTRPGPGLRRERTARSSSGTQPRSRPHASWTVTRPRSSPWRSLLTRRPSPRPAETVGSSSGTWIPAASRTRHRDGARRVCDTSHSLLTVQSWPPATRTARSSSGIPVTGQAKTRLSEACQRGPGPGLRSGRLGAGVGELRQNRKLWDLASGRAESHAAGPGERRHAEPLDDYALVGAIGGLLSRRRDAGICKHRSRSDPLGLAAGKPLSALGGSIADVFLAGGLARRTHAGLGRVMARTSKSGTSRQGGSAERSRDTSPGFDVSLTAPTARPWHRRATIAR